MSGYLYFPRSHIALNNLLNLIPINSNSFQRKPKLTATLYIL